MFVIQLIQMQVSQAFSPYMQPKRTVKPVLRGNSKVVKTNFLKTSGTCSLVQVKSIAGCSTRQLAAEVFYMYMLSISVTSCIVAPRLLLLSDAGLCECL